MIRTPTFTTPRLRLREVRRTDIPAYEKHFIDYEVVRYLTDRVPWPYPPDGVREYLDTFVFPYLGENKWVWAITERDGADELIGIIELWRPGRPEHRGFWLGRAYWGRGYMTEAVTPVMDFAFEVAGFERLVFANAVIATYGEQVVDAFYVKDMFGLKYYSESKQRSLEAKLRKAIDEGAERARG